MIQSKLPNVKKRLCSTVLTWHYMMSFVRKSLPSLKTLHIVGEELEAAEFLCFMASREQIQCYKNTRLHVGLTHACLNTDVLDKNIASVNSLVTSYHNLLNGYSDESSSDANFSSYVQDDDNKTFKA